jgi:hypothetical protein
MTRAVGQRIDHLPLRTERSIDERFLVRFPWLFRWGSRAILALPVRSRLRTAFVRRSLVSGWAAITRADFDLLSVRYASELAFDPMHGPVTLGLQERTEGLDASLASMRDFLDAWESCSFVPTYLLIAKRRLVPLGRLFLQGKTSGVDIELEYGQVIDLRNGLVVSQRDFASWTQALAVGGLEEGVADDLRALPRRGRLRLSS